MNLDRVRAVSSLDFAWLVRRPMLWSQMVALTLLTWGMSTGEVKLVKDLDQGLEGRDLLIVEDIVDTGLTLNYLSNLLGSRGPRSLKVATLLSKPARRLVEVHVDYVGFTIEDEFVVGYGLDYNERYRNLKDIVIYGG